MIAPFVFFGQDGLYDDAYLQFRFGRYFRKGTLNEYKAEEYMTRVNLEVGLGF